MRWNLGIPDSEYYEEGSDGLSDFAEQMAYHKTLAIDTETTGLDTKSDLPLFWSVSFGHRRVCLHANTLDRFKPILERPDLTLLLANAKFDKHILANAGITLQGTLHDVQVMHGLLYEEDSRALKNMCDSLLGWRWKDFPDTFKFNAAGKLSLNSTVEDVQKGGSFKTVQDAIMWCYHNDRQTLVEYASNDAFGTYKVYDFLKQKLQEAGSHSLFPDMISTLWDYFAKVEAPFTEVLWCCERAGNKIDTQYLEAIENPVSKDLLRIEREICKLVGRPVNPKSTKDLATYVHGDLGLPVKKMTSGGKTGVQSSSMSKETLEFYADNYMEARDVLNLVLEHRSLTKLLSTYVKGLGEHIDKKGRIHTQYNQAVARTGRLSSSNPNCFHRETELLTPNGWVRIDELPEGVSVAQWDNGVITFQVPTAYQQVPAAELVHIENNHTHLAVTKDHRCLVRYVGTTKVYKANSYPRSAVWQQLHAGHYNGTVEDTPTWLITLLVATHLCGKYTSEGVEITTSRSCGFDLSAGLDLGVVEHTVEKRRSTWYVKVTDAKTVEYVRNKLGDQLRLGPWLLHLTNKALRYFSRVLQNWVQPWSSIDYARKYISSNESDTLWVQTVLALTGHRTKYTKYETRKGTRYRVCASVQDYSPTCAATKKKLAYNDIAYCVSVPSSYVLTRFNGKISVTGQCQNIPNPENDKFKIRKAFIADRNTKLIVADYDTLEMRLLACATLEPSMVEMIRSGKDVHMGNATLVFGPIDGFEYDEISAAKKMMGRVNNGELPESAVTERMHLLLRRRKEIKTIGFGQQVSQAEVKPHQNGELFAARAA